MSAMDSSEGELESSSNASLSNRGSRQSCQTLAKMIASQTANIQVLVEQWLSLWKTRPSQALDILLGLLFESAGHIIANAEESLLITSNAYQKKLCNFFKLLLTPEALGQISLMKRLSSTLISMFNSKWKYFRFTAIVVGNQIILSLLEAEDIITSQITENNESMNPAQFKIELERQNMLKDCIHSQLVSLFRQGIRLRSRDVESEIRLKFLNSVLDWILNFPNKMAVDEYMKYINWFLWDGNSSVRLAAVNAIMKVVSKVNDLKKLIYFLKNNVPKLIIRINDVDSKVGGAAIRALDLIDRSFERMLSNTTYEKIYMEIYSTERNKSNAAGHVLLRKLGENNDENCLVDVIRFHLESPLKDHGEFLISAIFKNASFLTNWEDWINCFMNESDGNIKVIVCKLLLHTIRIAVTFQMPPWPVKNSIFHPKNEVKINQPRQLSAKDELLRANNQKSVTIYFSKRILNFLKQFKNDPKLLVYFLAMPQYFESGTDPMVMMSIIDEMQHIALTSENVEVIQNAFYHLAIVTNKLPEEWKAHVLKKLENLITKIVDEFYIPTVKKLFISEVTEESLSDEEVEVNLERAAKLANCFNLTNSPMVWVTLKGLRSSIQTHNFLGIKICANICYQNVSWMLNKILDSLGVQDNPSENEVTKLKFISQDLFDCSVKILSQNMSERAKSMAFIICCDLLTVFSIRNTKLIKFPSTVIQPTTAKLEWLANFLTTTVPASCEKETTQSLNHEHLLTKYCKLLEDNVIPTSNIANILLYFQVEGYIKIVSHPLCVLLRNGITMQSTITTIVYALAVLLERTQKGENLTEEALQKIVNGIGTSLKKKNSGLEKATQEMQVIGLECIYLRQNKVFFAILEFFVQYVRKTENIEKLWNLVMEYFPNSTDRNVIAYLASLNQVAEELERVKNSKSDATTTDDEAFFSDVDASTTRDIGRSSNSE